MSNRATYHEEGNSKPVRRHCGLTSRLLGVTLCCLSGLAPAQTNRGLTATLVKPASSSQEPAAETMSLEDVAGNLQVWAEENLDDQLLEALGEIDTDRAEEFLRGLQANLQNEYVIDLAELMETAKSMLPLLQAHPDTAPFGSWLAAEMDYLEVAEDIKTKLAPVKPGDPLPSKKNPTPKEQRELWTRKVSPQPWPAAAKTYIATLKPVFAARKAPGELVWLAEVESSFDPAARSPVGATGLFQLMPDTARQYGLRTFPLDERKNPVKNADAAARHLTYLHRKFKDWRLALAAYNAGEGTVERLLKKHKAGTFDEIANHLPAETQMYVPRVEAVLLKREGVRLTNLAAAG